MVKNAWPRAVGASKPQHDCSPGRRGPVEVRDATTREKRRKGEPTFGVGEPALDEGTDLGRAGLLTGHPLPEPEFRYASRISGTWGYAEMPRIAPSGDCSLATVWPHGSWRGGCRSSYPDCMSSPAAKPTAAASLTSNSILTCGTGRPAGQCGVPKQASAACDSGQTPNDLQPPTCSLCW